MQGKKIPFDRDQLYNLYWVEGLNGIQIAERLGYKFHAVYIAFKELGIPLRPKGIAMQMVCEQTGMNKYERNPAWKGGRAKHHRYIRLKLLPDDPFLSMVGRDNYCFEHRYVMAQSLGRPLLKEEKVHHINGVKDDNRVENLKLVSLQSHLIYSELCAQCPLRKRIQELERMLHKIGG